MKNPQAYDNWKMQEENIVGMAKENIYYDLIKSSCGFTELEGKNAYHSQNDKVNKRQYVYLISIFQTLCFQFLNLTLSNSSIKKSGL